MEKKNLTKKKNQTPIKSNIPVKKPSKAKFASTLVLLALGVALLPAGFLLSDLVQDRIDEGVADQVQVPHPHNSEFEEWETNDYEGAPEIYRSYYLWNLTNPDDFLAGDTPNYEEVGPFVFREIKHKYNIRFNDDKDEVTYKEYSTFLPSGGLNMSEVMITNMNPALLGSRATVGGTDMHYNQLNLPLVLSTVKEEFNTLFTDTVNEKLSDDNFIRDSLEEMLEACTAYAGVFPFIVPLDVTQAFIDCVGMDAIKEFMRDGLPSAEEVFFEEWANDYFPAFHGDYSILYDAASGINALLLKPIIDDKPCQDAQDTFITMQNARLVDESGSISGLGVDIDGQKGYLDGSESDLNISNANAVEVDHFTKLYSIIVAWSTMDLPIYGRSGGSGLNYSQCVALWDKSNPNSLTGFDYEENKIWYDAAEGDSDSKTFLKTEFSINDTQLDLILKWINVSTATWQPNAIEYTLNSWNSGVLTTRTAEEWLFTANDTAIYNHQVYHEHDVERALVNIVDNCYNTADAEKAEIPSLTVKTGRDDVNKIGQTVKYNGEDTIYIWAEPIEVDGTDGTQFAPGLTKEDTLKTFQTDLLRVAELKYTEDAEIYDIDLLRFELDTDTFSVNPTYYMDTNGLVNLAPIEKYRCIEVRVSRPHFLGAATSVQKGVNGIAPSKSHHNTYIEVEPITGIVMNARKRIQINFEVEPTEFYQPNIEHTVVPILWFEQSGEIPEDMAEDFKDLVYGALELKENLPLWGLGIGACLVVPGAGLSSSQVKKRRRYKQGKLAKGDKVLQNKIGTVKQKLGINAQQLKNTEVDKLKSDKLSNGEVSKPESDT